MTQADQPLRLRVASPADAADRAVLVRLADGGLDALEELYDRYKTMAYSIAYRITNDSTLAEDVVQDAFLGAWRNAASCADRARRLDGGRGRSRRRPRPARPGRAVGRPARGDRARLLQWPDAAG